MLFRCKGSCGERQAFPSGPRSQAEGAFVHNLVIAHIQKRYQRVFSFGIFEVQLSPSHGLELFGIDDRVINTKRRSNDSMPVLGNDV